MNCSAPGLNRMTTSPRRDMPEVLQGAPRLSGASSLPLVMIRCSVARSVVYICVLGGVASGCARSRRRRKPAAGHDTLQRRAVRRIHWRLRLAGFGVVLGEGIGETECALLLLRGYIGAGLVVCFNRMTRSVVLARRL